jgi:DNA-binding transcriptional LysR family regulator
MSARHREWSDMTCLELLVAIREHGSIGGAAQSLGISQPNASRSLRRLERRTRIPLLVRSTRGTSLTQEGNVVADLALKVMAAADELDEQIGSLSPGRAAVLRIAASLTVAEYWLPEWLVAFGAMFRSVETELSVVNSEVVMDSVADGEVDLGFIETSRVRSGLQRVEVCKDRMIVVVSPAHAWASRTGPIDPEELASAPLILREVGSGTREYTLRAFAERGINATVSAKSFSSNSAVKVAAMAGMGPAILSERALRESVASGQLVECVVDGVDLERTLSAVTLQGSYIPPVVHDFLSCVLDVAREPVLNAGAAGSHSGRHRVEQDS